MKLTPKLEALYKARLEKAWSFQKCEDACKKKLLDLIAELEKNDTN